jgi:hypothetical protein
VRAVRTEGASGRLWARSRDTVCGTCSTLTTHTSIISLCTRLCVVSFFCPEVDKLLKVVDY